MGDHRWRKVIADHDDRVRYQLASFRGREVKETGDGFLAIFDGTARAVRCAAGSSATRSGSSASRSERVSTRVRSIVPNDVRGVAVPRPPGSFPSAGPGDILVSGTTYELLAGSGLLFKDGGSHELKGLTGVRSVYVLEDPLASIANG